MKKMHIIFKTHLDVGFTDLAKKVTNKYIKEYIPHALDIGETLGSKFVWTTGSWLIDQYLSRSDVTENNKKRMKSAINAGVIKWHGLPFTTHTELMDRKLFEYGLSLSQKLDQKFKKETISAKMTDVPGHTIAIVPYMAKAGIKYLHIGVNASSAVPNVPEMFVWRNKDGSEIIVHYSKNYGAPFVREGWDDMLYFAFTHDNQGPPANTKEIEKLYEELANQYPSVELVASNLDDFAEVAWEHKEELPVIEEEIGDSWIHGVGTDPKKTSQYEMLLAIRSKWLLEGTMTEDSEEYQQLSEQLLLITEHTWGGNENVFLPDYRNFLLEDFQKARKKSTIDINSEKETMDFADLMTSVNPDDLTVEKDRSYKKYEETWKEQREYIQKSLDSLSGAHRKEAKNLFAESAIKIDPLISENQVLLGKIYNFEEFEIAFSQTGAIQTLNVNQVSLLEEGKKFGELTYERFGFEDFQHYIRNYGRLNQLTSVWALVDLNKRGIEAYSEEIQHEIIFPYIEKSAINKERNHVTFEFDLKFEAVSENKYGVPTNIRLSFDLDFKKKQIEGIIKWENKQANRMPEAYWLESSLSVANPYRWQMHKLGEPISPYNVVFNGNRNMHALSKKGLTYQGAEGHINITSKETRLFSFGGRNLLKFDNAQPSLQDGIFMNLYNNIWGTNFPAWFEDDLCYHFAAKLDITRTLNSK